MSEDTYDEIDNAEDLKAGLRALGAVVPSRRDDREIDPVEAEVVELPGAVLEGSLTIEVLPMTKGEFECGDCHLVQHRALRSAPDSEFCRDCA